MYYNLIASAEESTVLAQYVREERAPYAAYQSEAALERALIVLLEEEGYTYLRIHDEAELLANLREQLSALNDYAFSDAEWELQGVDRACGRRHCGENAAYSDGLHSESSAR